MGSHRTGPWPPGTGPSRSAPSFRVRLTHVAAGVGALFLPGASHVPPWGPATEDSPARPWKSTGVVFVCGTGLLRTLVCLVSRGRWSSLLLGLSLGVGRPGQRAAPGSREGPSRSAAHEAHLLWKACTGWKPASLHRVGPGTVAGRSPPPRDGSHQCWGPLGQVRVRLTPLPGSTPARWLGRGELGAPALRRDPRHSRQGRGTRAAVSSSTGPSRGRCAVEHRQRSPHNPAPPFLL